MCPRVETKPEERPGREGVERVDGAEGIDRPGLLKVEVEVETVA